MSNVLRVTITVFTLAATSAIVCSAYAQTTTPSVIVKEERGLFDAILEYLGVIESAQAPPTPPPPRKPAPDLFAALPKLSIGPAEQTVNETAGAAVLKITRNVAAGEEGVSVRVTAISATANPGADFEDFNQVITFAKEQKVQEIRIPVKDNLNYDPNVRTFVVQLSESENASIDRNADKARVHIQNDDPEPVQTPPAELRLSLDELLFGKVTVNSSGMAVRETSLINSGGKPIPRVDLLLDDVGEGVFFLVSDECTARPLPPGGACLVTIGFKPLGQGRYKGHLRFITEAGDTEAVLFGRGTLPPFIQNPADDARAAAVAARRGVTGQVKTFTPDAPQFKPEPTYDNADPDYRKVGVGRNYFTYEVDRSRIITVDRVIPCVLEDRINSQIPGFTHCVVEQNVFGADGRLILIPKGSRVIGDYGSLDGIGETRLNVIWRRIITPKGASISIPNASGFQGADVAGTTGLPGHIDNRWLEKYGMSVLLTGIAVGAALAVPSNNEDLANASQTMADNIGQISYQILQENLEIKPVIQVPAGTRLNIIPVVDIWFKRPREIVPAPQTQIVAAEGATR